MCLCYALNRQNSIPSSQRREVGAKLPCQEDPEDGRHNRKLRTAPLHRQVIGDDIGDDGCKEGQTQGYELIDDQ